MSSNSVGADHEMGDYFTERWKEAHQMCCKNLEDWELRDLEEIKDCNEFRDSITRMHGAFVHLSTQTVLSRLSPSLASLTNFVTLLAVAMGSTPVNTAIIWGVLSLFVRAASGMSTILTETIIMLDTLGHDLEILQIYEQSFTGNDHMGQELIEIFVEIISFWTQAIHFLRRRRFELSAIEYWPRVKKDFEESSKRIRTRSARIKEKADALASVSSRPAVLVQEMDRFDEVIDMHQPSNDSFTPRTSTFSREETVYPCHNIPYQRNIHFLARDKELKQIESSLAADPSYRGVKSFAIWGTGGIGKTQTALAYAYKAIDCAIDAVLWVDCETGLSISSSFMQIAAILQLPGALADENTDRNRLLVLSWLRKTSVSWLMILDNVEDNELARDCWPAASHGAVLVTSRRSIVAIDPAASGSEMQQFSDIQGASILLHLVGRPAYNEKEEEAAQKLSGEVGGLGLALGVMAAQIRLSCKSFWDFLDYYKKYTEHLHQQTFGLKDYKGSLHTCWHNAFQNLSPNCVEILGVLAFMAPDNVPDTVFQAKPSKALPDGLVFCDDELERETTFFELLDKSLVRREPATRTLSVHRLVQYEFRAYMSISQRRRFFFAAAALLYEAFPKQVYGSSLRNEAEQCKAHVQHVLALCMQWRNYKFKPEIKGEYNLFTKLLTNCGWYLLETGGWAEEIKLMQTAFDTCEDKDGLDYAHLCNTLCCVEVERGNTSKAIDLVGKALKIRRNLLGENELETAASYNNLANTIQQGYTTPKAFEEAVEVYMKAINIVALQPEENRARHCWVKWFNISRPYRLLGKYKLAHEYVDLAEQGIQQLFKPGSFFYATLDVHRANILFDEGKIEAAEKLWRRAFVIYKSLNETHPSTLFVQLKLATLAMRRNEVDNALAILNKLLAVCKLREKSKGDKGEIARVTRRLAEATAMKGRDEEAAQFHRSAEEMRKEIQKDRVWQLPDEERAYDILVWNEYW